MSKPMDFYAWRLRAHEDNVWCDERLDCTAESPACMRTGEEGFGCALHASYQSQVDTDLEALARWTNRPTGIDSGGHVVIY